MSVKNKTIFLTGGAGFIANKIISRLIEDNKIIVFDNFERDTLTSSGLSSHPNLKIVNGDVRDFELVYNSMYGADIVIHAAAIAGITTVALKPVKTMEVNIIGTYNVLEAARKRGITGKIIDFSTSETYGEMAYNSKESDNSVVGVAGVERWTYSASKLAAEHFAHAYHKEYGLNTVTVKPFNVYGPGQLGEGALQIFINKCAKNEDLFINGDGNQIRSWCFVEDFVDGIMLCLSDAVPGGKSFNIGNPRETTTIYELAKKVITLTNSESKIKHREGLAADVGLRIPNIDSLRHYGYAPKVNIEDGIMRTIEYFKQLEAAHA